MFSKVQTSDEESYSQLGYPTLPALFLNHIFEYYSKLRTSLRYENGPIAKFVPPWYAKLLLGGSFSMGGALKKRYASLSRTWCSPFQRLSLLHVYTLPCLKTNLKEMQEGKIIPLIRVRLIWGKCFGSSKLYDFYLPFSI